MRRNSHTRSKLQLGSCVLVHAISNNALLSPETPIIVGELERSAEPNRSNCLACCTLYSTIRAFDDARVPVTEDLSPEFNGMVMLADEVVLNNSC